LKSSKVFSVFISSLLLFTAANAQQKGFKTDPSGLQYRFIKQDKNGAKAPENDVARITMLWTGKNAKGDADTVIRNSYLKINNFGDSLGTILVPLQKIFQGSLEQGIMMMAKGDSAIFLVNTDSLFIKAFHFPSADKFPPFVKNNHTFSFYIKLVSFETKDQAMAEKKAARESEMKKNKIQESVNIATFLKKNYPAVKPETDSIFYLETVKGKGPQVKEGDSLEIKYKGTFLDGKVFDQSDKGPGPGTYKIVFTRNMALIQGWISVLGKMNEGDKVKVLIPSKMAYGPQGRSQIPPYAPLIFDMELVRLKSNK
jgi:FKBP-type peptidyl-prolyl cis-trans isomerase FkpA